MCIFHFVFFKCAFYTNCEVWIDWHGFFDEGYEINVNILI